MANTFDFELLLRRDVHLNLTDFWDWKFFPFLFSCRFLLTLLDSWCRFWEINETRSSLWCGFSNSIDSARSLSLSLLSSTDLVRSACVFHHGGCCDTQMSGGQRLEGIVCRTPPEPRFTSGPAARTGTESNRESGTPVGLRRWTTSTLSRHLLFI